MVMGKPDSQRIMNGTRASEGFINVDVTVNVFRLSVDHGLECGR
jgi:hypothetical protein